MSRNETPQIIPFPQGDPLDLLARDALKGDVQAQKELLLALQQPLWRWMVRLVGPQGQAGFLVEDLVQEGLTKIWRKLRHYQPGRAFRPWAARVARNHALDLLRSKTAQQQKQEQNLSEHQDPEDQEPIHQDFGLSRLLAELIAKLPENQRASLLFREREGWSYREIAQVLGTTESTVRNHVMLAKGKIRQWLQEHSNSSSIPISPGKRDKP